MAWSFRLVASNTIYKLFLICMFEFLTILLFMNYALSIQVVDMRWGVRDEMTNEHQTTELCMTELRNCQRLSMGPNFIYFGAQKYGYR